MRRTAVQRCEMRTHTPRHSFPPSGRSRRAEQSRRQTTQQPVQITTSLDRFITMFSSYIVSAESAAASAYRSASCRIRSARSQPDLRLCRAATPPYKPPEPHQCPVRTAKPVCLPEHPRCRLSPCRDCPRYCDNSRRPAWKMRGAVSLVRAQCTDSPARTVPRPQRSRSGLPLSRANSPACGGEHDRLCRSLQYILMAQ